MGCIGTKSSSHPALPHFASASKEPTNSNKVVELNFQIERKNHIHSPISQIENATIKEYTIKLFQRDGKIATSSQNLEIAILTILQKTQKNYKTHLIVSHDPNFNQAKRFLLYRAFNTALHIFQSKHSRNSIRNLHQIFFRWPKQDLQSFKQHPDILNQTLSLYILCDKP